MPYFFSRHDFTPHLKHNSHLWEANACLSPFDTYALLLGMSLFTTFRSDASFCWQRAHLKRLHSQAIFLQWEVPSFRDFAEALTQQLQNALQALETQLETQEVYRIRITLFPYRYKLSHSPLQIACLISLESSAPVIPNTLPPRRSTAIIKRYENPLPTLKHGSQFPSLLLHQSREESTDHVLWQDAVGYITESTFANLFYHHPEAGWCVPPKAQALEGITRQQVLKAFQQCEVPLQERAWHVNEMVDVVFLTNSIQGWQRLSEIHHANGINPLSTSEILDEALSKVYQAWHALAFDERNSCYASL